MNAAIVIPARWASTRFPGKPLAPIRGKSLIQRVWERVSATRGAGLIVVATDDDRIESHVTGFGGRVVRTAAALPSIETAEGKRFEIVINVQGDEPLIDPASVDRMIETLRADDADVVTMYSALRDEEEFLRRDVVKVVGSGDGYALYFSRAPVPHGGTAIARRHIGVYGYRRHALAAFASLPQSSLELAESLEQLRLLENGFRIRLLESSAPHLGVDRPEDIQRIEDELDRLQLP
jgi:3-deoxy-D-manno-octulosonate cytidylyltransferase